MVFIQMVCEDLDWIQLTITAMSFSKCGYIGAKVTSNCQIYFLLYKLKPQIHEPNTTFGKDNINENAEI
jgi:hypothetical protein